MRLVTAKCGAGVGIGIQENNVYYMPFLSSRWNNLYPDMLALIDAGPPALAALKDFVADEKETIRVLPQDLQLLAPIPRPRQNVICMGWNYAQHVAETQGAAVPAGELPKHPVVFTKAAACVAAPHQDVPYDREISVKLDWEVELAVVIGRSAYKVPPSEALKYVFGYTVINDISARELQKRHRQFYLAKSLRASCPMGPCIVTADEIPDPQKLILRSWVNGILKQNDSTASQIFDVAAVVSTVSRTPGLEAGDIIATGTPSGVGYVRTPPEYLKPGDLVECEVEHIGKIGNRITELALRQRL